MRKLSLPLVPAALLLLAGLCAASPAQASFITGQILLQQCDQSPSSCTQYVVGVYDGFANMAEVFSLHLPFCVPPQVKGQELTQVVLTYLHHHPEKQGFTAAGEILIALGEAFPCAAPASPTGAR